MYFDSSSYGVCMTKCYIYSSYRSFQCRELYHPMGEQNNVLHCDCVWACHLEYVICTLKHCGHTCIYNNTVCVVCECEYVYIPFYVKAEHNSYFTIIIKVLFISHFQHIPLCTPFYHYNCCKYITCMYIVFTLLHKPSQQC